MSCIIFLTGERGIGKSTICRRTIDLAQSKGYACAGIITLARDGVRNVVDVSSGALRRLTQAEYAARAVEQGHFRFDPRTLSWGDTKLGEATPCDLLVVDEIGPLELERGEGWVNALDVLRCGDFTLALVVVRPRLVTRARLRLGNRTAMVMTVTQQNRDELPGALLSLLGEMR
jgi:nucleoside-triphosphatase THEP1